MVVTYDPEKREATLRQRGLDFEDALRVFAAPTFEMEDSRRDYGEVRIRCFGYLEGRMVVIVYTPRGEDRHVLSMRKANGREERRTAPKIRF